MRIPKLSTSLLPLLALALPAQDPAAPQNRTAAPPAAPVDVTRGAGLQADGPGRLLGCGTDYLVRFSAAGMQFVPALGPAAEQVRHVDLHPVEVRRGERTLARVVATEPSRSGLRATYEHEPSMTERYDVGADGVEVSWRFEQRPAGSGDLVVRYRLDTNLPLAAGGDGVRFVQEDLGGVAIGAVTGIDARGERVPGALAYANGALEMSLPAAFVDAATYPIVLDPVIGPVFTVASTTNDDVDPDIAYDASTQRYFVVWLRTLAANLVLPRGRLVDATNTPVGNVILLGSTGVCGRPRVANHPGNDYFGVVFEEQAGAFHGIQLRVVKAQTGAIEHLAVIASSAGVDLYRKPDIGGSIILTNTAFVVVYEDNIQNAIRARRVYFTPQNQLMAPSPVDIWTDSGGPIANVYTDPAISRQDGIGLDFMVVARRFSGIGPTGSVAAKLIDQGDLSTVASTSFGSTTADVGSPDVDGANGTWVVAWERDPSGTTSVERRSARYDGSSLTLGPIESLSGSLLVEHRAPSVGWSAGRTWLGYHHFSGIGPQESLRVAAVDTGDATWGGVELSQTITSNDTRIVVATDASGGVNGGTDAMAAFAHGTTVYAQRLISYGNGGTFTSLGGQCGNGGVQYFSHAPGIGSSIVFGVAGLSPTAAISVFNLTPDLNPIACGSCEWAPFAITSVRLVTSGTSAMPFVLPMHPSLVGSQWITQWTTWDPPQAPCPLVPDFVLTERSLMTIGN